MGSRSTNLRTKVVALLASLVALWAFAAWVTVRDGFNLLGVQVLDTQIFDPSEPLLLELQLERRASLTYLGQPSEQQRAALADVRRQTDQLAADFKESVAGWQVSVVADKQLEQRIASLTAGLDRLPRARAQIDERSVDRATAARAFTDVIESIYRVLVALGNLDDEQIAKDTASLIELNRARELLSQEDALLAGVLAAGRITPAERAQFAEIVGARHFISQKAVAELPAADQHRYAEMSNGEVFRRLGDLESQVMAAGGAKLPISFAAWTEATQPAMKQISEVVLAGGDDVVDRATPVAIWVVVRLLLAAGLGLIAVVASIVVSITTARALVRQLERLREAAWQLANERLPRVVERLGHGEEVDVATEAPPLEFGNDEIGQVGQAFNAVQETAIRTAVEQAELRRSVRDVFLSLARRTQALVHRQLALLDGMERREDDAEELEDLFRVDHLATRMRRNAENLIVLSGSTPGRAWRRNVPMVDVVRGAVAEVEDYTRVNVLPFGSVSLAGRAVGDMIHLLAELIENGLSFSPPHTSVEVRGQMVGSGFAIEIEDRGLGMSPEDLAAANARIEDHSELNLANATRLGLYVVSRLSERHGVRVRLRESPYGGTTAVVLIPLDLVSESDEPESSGGFRAGSGVPAQSAPARPAGPPAPRTAGPVALADPPAAPAGPALAEHRAADSTQVTAAGEVPSLPTRTRRFSEHPALDGPTFPTGLPITTSPEARRQQTAESPAAPAPADPVDDASAGAPEATTRTGPKAAPQAPTRTDAGLPIRVRQASLAPQLRAEEEATDTPGDEVGTPRPPEQIRRMMSSYQSGTRRGRTDAARLLGSKPGPGAEPEAGDDADDEEQRPT